MKKKKKKQQTLTNSPVFMNEKQLNIVNFKTLSQHRSVHAESKGRFND